MTFIAKIRKNVDNIFSIIFDDRGPLIKFYFFHELKINYFFKIYNLIKIFYDIHFLKKCQNIQLKINYFFKIFYDIHC